MLLLRLYISFFEKYFVKNKKSNIFNCGYGKGYSVKKIIDTFNNFILDILNLYYGYIFYSIAIKNGKESKQMPCVINWGII